MAQRNMAIVQLRLAQTAIDRALNCGLPIGTEANLQQIKIDIQHEIEELQTGWEK